MNMKKILIFAFAITLLASCSDEYFDINRSPDNLDVDAAALSTELPAGLVGLAAAEDSYYALIGGFWSQFWTQSNASNQYKDIDNYSIGTLDYNGGWTAIYDALGDIRNIKSKAAAQNNWNYYLIATVMETQGSQLLADFYDQAPYSQANNQNFSEPVYDSGQEIYDAMVANLQDALGKDLSASEGEVPGNDDFVFGGDMAKWKAFANTELLKIYMRQTQARPDVAQAGITALLTSGVAFLDNDAAITQFVDEPNRSNPLYESDRRQLNVATNLRASKTMYSYLSDNNDPRLSKYYGPGAPMNQGDFNSTAGATGISVVNLSATTPVYFMSREESLFLQAEALERYAGGAGAKEKYDAGVQSNFSKWGLNGAPFVAPGGAYEYPAAGSLQDKIQAIITQKWISSFPGNGFESFFEQERTGYPMVSAVPQSSDSYVPGEFSYSVNGVTSGTFPHRIVFPETSTSTNHNAPALVEITVPVWWDVN
jgi:hypothetical protein